MLLQTVLGEVQVADGALAFAGSLQVMGGGGGGWGTFIMVHVKCSRCVCVCPVNPQVEGLVQVHELVEQMVDEEWGRVLGCGDNPELDSE